MWQVDVCAELSLPLFRRGVAENPEHARARIENDLETLPWCTDRDSDKDLGLKTGVERHLVQRGG